MPSTVYIEEVSHGEALQVVGSQATFLAHLTQVARGVFPTHRIGSNPIQEVTSDVVYVALSALCCRQLATTWINWV